MKQITAIVKPFKLEEVREALAEIGVSGLTVTEVKGSAARRVTPSSTAAPNTSSTSCPRSRSRSSSRTATPSAASTPSSRPRKTGKIGDGKIFVTEIEHVVRIRTGEINEDAV